jgi:hypothetical protein
MLPPVIMTRVRHIGAAVLLAMLPGSLRAHPQDTWLLRYTAANTTIRVLLISLLLAACSGAVVTGAETRKVTLVIWGGHFTPAYWQLKDSKSKRILFRKEVALLEQELNLTATELLKTRVEGQALKDRLPFLWRGVVYRPRADGSSAEVVFDEGAIDKFKLSSLQSQDIIVFLLRSDPVLLAGHTLRPHRSARSRPEVQPFRYVSNPGGSICLVAPFGFRSTIARAGAPGGTAANRDRPLSLRFAPLAA